jgi:hypothetical protein
MGKAWVSGTREPQVNAVTWGYGAPRGNRTPNPLIVGLVCSTLLIVGQYRGLTWGFVVRLWCVVPARLLTLPVESRPVSRAEIPSWWVIRPAGVDGYVSSTRAVLRNAPIAADPRFGSVSGQGMSLSSLYFLRFITARPGASVGRTSSGSGMPSLDQPMVGEDLPDCLPIRGRERVLRHVQESTAWKAQDPVLRGLSAAGNPVPGDIEVGQTRTDVDALVGQDIGVRTPILPRTQMHNDAAGLGRETGQQPEQDQGDGGAGQSSPHEIANAEQSEEPCHRGRLSPRVTHAIPDVYFDGDADVHWGLPAAGMPAKTSATEVARREDGFAAARFKLAHLPFAAVRAGLSRARVRLVGPWRTIANCGELQLRWQLPQQVLGFV